MSDASKQLAGILFVLVPTIEFGGWSLLRMIARRIPGYLDNRCARTCSGPATPTPGCC